VTIYLNINQIKSFAVEGAKKEVRNQELVQKDLIDYL